MQIFIIAAGFILPRHCGPTRTGPEHWSLKIVRAAAVIGGPTVIGFGILVLASAAQYTVTCGGWGDSQPVPCSFGSHADQSASWSAMLLFIPGLVGVFAASIISYRRWMDRQDG